VIAFLTGILAEKGVGHCLLDVGGVGFRLAMSTSSLAALPSEGDGVTIHTSLYVREDELSLFGFESAEEKSLFEALLTVSGVGPKVALAALSALAPDTLAEAIARENAALIASVPGIGKKTAQRIILDLKDKLGLPDLAGGVPTAGIADMDVAAAATQALLGMGFSSSEIANALKGYEGAAADTQALLKHALRRLGGGV
jgi:Holliday junction DNA helicase RuvA